MTARVLCSDCGRRRVKYMLASEIATFGSRPLCSKCANARWEMQERFERAMSATEALVS